MMDLKSISKKIILRQRVSREEILFVWLNASDDWIKDHATCVKKRFHEADTATYLIMAIVNYTNVCVAKCSYCSFYRLPHQSGTYLKTFEEICEKIDQLLSLGGRMVGLNGGFHPKLRIDDYAELFEKIRGRYGDKIEFYGMTVAELMFASRISKMDYHTAARTLGSRGSRWITGGGAEILDDRFRARHSPGKYKTQDYFAAQRAVLEEGLGSTATMVIGFDETIDERLSHLEALRDFQDSVNGGLTSFLCWTYKAYGNDLGDKLNHAEIANIEYLRWLGICRIYLDNFVNIRTSVLTKNDVAVLGLLYGANDFDLPTEDEVTQKAGATISHDFETILERVKDLNLNPVMRMPFSLQERQRHPSKIDNQGRSHEGVL